MEKVVVIGGGPAGMMAAGISASKGNKVILLEKNTKLGKKLAITGKGRCNITNAGDIENLLNNVLRNKKFLYSSFYSFSNYDVINFFEEKGVKTKVERGNRVFPVSDKAQDVVKCLEKFMLSEGVVIKKNCCVKKIYIENNKIKGVITVNNEKINCDAVVIATGGLSYPVTGSTGDGYIFAKKCGHDIVECKPSLVPLNIKENWIKELQGLSLKNIEIKIMDNGNIIYKEFGEMLFTHFGVSGPIILSASAYIPYNLMKPLKLIIDLKPALDEEMLDKRLIRDFEKNLKKDFKNCLGNLLPKKLIPVIIKLSNINPEKKVYEITKNERKHLLKLLKGLEFTITGTRNIKEAIITSGGIDVKGINPKTMESKLILGLYFVGEVLDVDALTGGYNLQIAFSTGYLAGKSI